jgi:histidinol-phosphatase
MPYAYARAMALADDLALALELADLADAISAPAFGNISGERKVDGTAVTAIDREIEARLRAELSAARPADDVIGEDRLRGR